LLVNWLKNTSIVIVAMTVTQNQANIFKNK